MYTSKQYLENIIRETSTSEFIMNVAGGAGLGGTLGALFGGGIGLAIGYRTKKEMQWQIKRLENELKKEKRKHIRDAIEVEIAAIERQLKLGVIKQSGWKGYIRGLAAGGLIGAYATIKSNNPRDYTLRFGYNA